MALRSREHGPRACVFLDRDGVLNQSRVEGGKPIAPRRIDDFRLFDDALPATRALANAGFFLVVVTNQPDVGNGDVSRETVDAMNAQLSAALPVDDVRVCFHAQTAGCDCRKPKPGMLIAAAADHHIDLDRSFMVGDRWSDVEAGRRAGCRTVFIDREYGETPDDDLGPRVSSMIGAAQYILKHTQDGAENAET